MTREYMDNLLNQLKDDVLILESMVREAVLNGVKALMTGDKKLSKQVIRGDQEINDKRFQIENECLITIATQQPMAGDLRTLASVLEIITELERIGDYAKGIAKITKLTRNQEILPPLENLVPMAEISVDMLQKSVKAFVDGDVEAARVIPDRDDQVDDYFNKIYKGLVKYMVEDPDKIKLANHLQWAAHNIERMADRVTNICERTLFIQTGSIYQIEDFKDLDLDDDEVEIHDIN
ncbi:MAG: phosphate signaling complex protein PhoU [Anaerolineales bacterium]|nr:phosphate signaling complex protein PhoU [Anaerolineales bacterium]